MKPGRFKVVGAALLLLALVGSLTSWSAVRAGDDGSAYFVVNLVLFIAGAIALVWGYRLAKKPSP